jgi:osmotically-inducible protein OsmY
MSLKNKINILAAGAVGASLMYILDPILGKRRRAILRDKAFHYSKVAERGMNTSARNAAHRLRGLAALSGHAFQSEDVFDDVLVERVRSAMGRVVSHPSSIEVHARGGLITLSGEVPEEEHHGLLNRVRRVRGVHMVDDKLKSRQEREGEPPLQAAR